MLKCIQQITNWKKMCTLIKCHACACDKSEKKESNAFDAMSNAANQTQ